MKKAIALSAVSLAVTGALSAQGLYNIMPYDDEPLDALPLQWVAGVTLGYDDNATPTGSELYGKSDTSYIAASLQANYANVQPQTTLDFWARVGAQYFLDSIPRGTAGSGSADDVGWDLGVGVNVTRRVSERLRLRSRNDIVYQLEPDYTTGDGVDSRVGQYFRYSTDNSVGYSWTERFATVTGYRLSGVSYDDIGGADYVNHIFYNQFRYRLSPATVLTASYRFSTIDNDASRDSDAHHFLVGAEHKFSPATVGVLRAGVARQDGTTTNTKPYVEAMLKVQTNEQFSFRGFLRYGYEDRNVSVTYQNVAFGPFLTGMYDERSTLRIGTQANYAVSPDLSIFGGVNVVLTGRDTPLHAVGPGTAPASFDEELYNLNLGASLRVAENVFVNGTYNFTSRSSDGGSREYDRNRVTLGVRTNF